MWKRSYAVGSAFAAVALAGALTLVALLPSDATAQERGIDDGWWEWALLDHAAGERLLTTGGRAVWIGDARGRRASRDHRARAIDRRLHRDRLQWERGAHRQLRGPPSGRRGGPAFCRSGEGHPVFGRAWCREMGFGRGGQDIVWRRGGPGEIIFGRHVGHRGGHRGAPHGRGGILEETHLIELLGQAVLRQLLVDGGRSARSGPLSGRWLELDGGGAALQLRSGGRPLAELTDLEGDGRVDVLLIAELLGR